MTTSEVETSPKVLATHRYRSAVVYVRQSTPGQVEHNTESTDRQYALAERAVRLGWARDAVRIIDADLGPQRREHRGSFRVRRADHPGRSGSGGNRSGAGGFPARPEQLRLVPAAGPGRDDEHAARRRRRRLPSGVVQRPDAAGPEGNNVAKQNCTCCGPGWTAGYGTRPNAGNCAAACRSGWSGARTRARSCCTRTRPSPGSSPRCSPGSPRAGRSAGPGCGCGNST